MTKQKKIQVLVGIILCALTLGYIHQNKSKEVVLSSLSLENIEALAHGEVDENYHCYGYGEIDCYGAKVELKISGFR